MNSLKRYSQIGVQGLPRAFTANGTAYLIIGTNDRDNAKEAVKEFHEVFNAWLAKRDEQGVIWRRMPEIEQKGDKWKVTARLAWEQVAVDAPGAAELYELGPHNSMSTQQALEYCARNHYEYDHVLVLGYGADGKIIIRSSGMNRADANFIIDAAKMHICGKELLECASRVLSEDDLA